MKVFVTGGTGFIGGHVVRRLIDRGDEVIALVRNPEKGKELRDIGADLVEGDLSDEVAIRNGMRGCDAVIHGAAVYEVGIPKDEHPAMYEANVRGTERVLRAVLEEKVPKAVYISTVGAFGNTHGRVVDESYHHPGEGFTSYYEETKVMAHQIARRLIDDEGLPCVIVQPGGVYGPGDHSAIGNQINQFLAGRMPLIPFPDLGFNMVHVDDVAGGVLLALDKGGRRGLRAGWPDHDDARVDGDAGAGGRQEGAEARDADGRAQGDDPDRAGGRQADGPAAQPLRADQRRRRRHLLGQARQGDRATRLLSPRPRAGPARHASG